VVEFAGASAVGVVGGRAEIDCAYPVAANPVSNPRPRTVDLNKLGIPGASNPSIRELYAAL